MERVYNICIIIGFALPLLSLLLGGLFDMLDGVEGLLDSFELDLDLSVDIGGTNVSLFPVSLQSLCAGLLVFGVGGRLMWNGENTLASNAIGIACGYLAAIAVQTFISRLKKVENKPLTQEELLYCSAKVTNTIVAGGFGAVSIRTREGASLSYPAKAADSTDSIRQDTEVHILRFDKNIAIVKPARSSQAQELTMF